MIESLLQTLKERFPGLVSIKRKLFRGGSGIIQKTIIGKGNIFQAEGAALSNVKLDIVGDNNCINIGSGCALSNVYFRLRGSGHRITFGEKCRISRGAVLWFEDRDGVLEVGSGTTMVDVHIAVTESAKVTIGEDCMFANDIDIRTGDSHSVVDERTGERLNFAGNVEIGRHVWIAPHAVILKQIHIGDKSIIATGSVVTKSCDPGSIMGGNPAKVLKTGVSWTRKRISR